MTIPFVKMHGAGNDFVLMDDRAACLPLDADFISRLANRPDGIGCEGVIVVRNAAAGDDADFEMRFFNPDGSEAELCGNGARCVAAFAREIGAAKGRRMAFRSKAGRITAELLDGNRVRVGMPAPKDLRENFVNSGVPHAIVPVEDLAAADVAGEGRRIRYSVDFAPAGTNVDFVRYELPSRAYVRTYERGVEAETFACGTGAVAAAVVGVAQHSLAFPVTVVTSHGDELEVGGRVKDGVFQDVTLTGPVRRVFNGEIEMETKE